MIEIVVMIVMGVISPLMMYIVGKRLTENAVFNAKEEILDYLQTEEGAKQLFTIGALIGNGVKSGVGLTKGTGKFKWQDLVGQIAGQYLQGLLPQKTVASSGEPQKNVFRT